MSEPHADIEREGARIVDAAREGGVPVRLIGGVAIALHASDGLPEALRRSYRDIDLVTLRGRSGEVSDLMVGLGYEPNTSFNTLNGADRLVFYDQAQARQIDVFVGSFRMCHEIPISAERFDADPLSLPLAELLLTKLQIVSLNEKDVRDVYAIVHEHEVGESDADAINAAVVGELLARDWGLWRTARGTVERAQELLPDSALDAPARERIAERLDLLWRRVEERPKGLRWKSRARVGDRVKWYEEPSEIAHQELG